MEKKAATELVEKTFNARFDIEQYTLFMRNLLNDYDEQKERDWAQGNYIYESFREHINRFKRIGVYTDPEGNEVELLIIETKATAKLERARTSLRNFVIKRLNDKNRDFALAAFYSKEDNGADWRFSFIKIEHESYKDTKGKVKTKKELTPAKRFSFLVGEHEHAYTAQKQLLPVLQNDFSNPNVKELESCFSIEKVTDEFFEQYKELYLKLSEHFSTNKAIQKILVSSGIDSTRFTKKLLGQIVFLYFLQKKGWLGVPKNEPWGKGDKKFIQSLFDEANSQKQNFFKDFLQYLFYEALAKARTNSHDPAYYKRFDCKIPFLNGGLFEADYDWQNANLSVPNNLFRNEEKNKAGDRGTGILDVFDRYNFTIKEDEPLEKEVAVDPEMLGKVFENMLEVTERKSKGAFYTPREIVHYMCQESLINYLNNAINDSTEGYQALDSDQLGLFSGATTKKGQEKQEIEHNGKILVPFPDIETFVRKGFLATENDQIIIEKGKETSSYKFQLPETVRTHADELDKHLTNIKICDPAIGSGAFPVGLLHELVTAQKVLLPYLSEGYLNEKLNEIDLDKAQFKLDSTKYIYRIKRHAIQESIYGVDIDASAIDIARLRLWLSLIVDEEDFYSIEALPNLDYKIVQGNSLIGLPDNAMKDLATEVELEKLKDNFFNETNETVKKRLREKINTTIRKLLDSAEQFAGYKIDFDLKLFFSEVWHYKNGFDIVIANPPYVFTRGQEFDVNFKLYFDNYLISKNIFKSNKGLNVQSGKINLFGFFVLRAVDFANSRADINFIIPNNILRATTYDLIREYLLKRTTISLIADLGKGIFKNVTASTIILRYKPRNKKNNKIKILTGVTDITADNLKAAFIEQDYFLSNVSYTINILIDEHSLKIIKNITQGSIQLGKLCKYISPGIDGDKEAFVKETPENSNFKKLLYGKDFGRYEIRFQNHFIEYDRKKLNRAREEEIYLSEKIILQRISGGSTPLKSTLDTDKYYTFNSVNNIVLFEKSKFNIKYILACLNSDILNWYYAINFSNKSELTVNISKTFLEVLPIKEAYDNRITILVDYLLFIKRYSKSEITLSKYIDQIINSLVYEIYLPEAINSANKCIAKHLGDIIPLLENMTPEKKLSIIQSEFNRLYDPIHPVRNNIESLDSVEEVRIIKEALK